MNDDDDSDVYSVYDGPDDERMTTNSTYEDGKSYAVFNEDVDIEKPIFQLGMIFRSSSIFGKVVKIHVFLDRTPVENVRNYGKKVKYICQPYAIV